MMHTKVLLAAALVFAPLAMADVVVPVDKVSSYVNVRGNPDASADVVGRLNQGDSLPHLGTENGWRKVKLEGDAVGYISADWTNLVAEALGDEVTADDAVAEIADASGDEDAAPEAPAEPVEQAADEAVADAEQAEEAIAEPAEVADAVPAAEPAEEPEPADATVAENEHADVVDPATSGDAVVLTGPPGPPGPPGAATVEGTENYVMKFIKSTIGGNSQIFDDGRNIGIGTTEPKQRLEVNGSIQIHEQNSSVAGLMITQASGETGYIMHNRASTLTIGAGSVDRVTIDRDGNVGIGQERPTHPLEMASGAHVTPGGVWTNSSSIENKENVESLMPEEALAALAALEPVLFNYKTDRVDRHVGFIAEEVPELVASPDRKGLSSMDIVAVLTRVVQLQQQRIEALERRLDE